MTTIIPYTCEDDTSLTLDDTCNESWFKLINQQSIHNYYGGRYLLTEKELIGLIGNSIK